MHQDRDIEGQNSGSTRQGDDRPADRQTQVLELEGQSEANQTKHKTERAGAVSMDW